MRTRLWTHAIDWLHQPWKRPTHRWIVVAVEFGIAPQGREPVDGPDSGRRLYEELLLPALQLYERVTVDFTGTAAIAASFFDAAFGELIADQVAGRLKIVSERSLDGDLAWNYINRPDPASAEVRPSRGNQMNAFSDVRRKLRPNPSEAQQRMPDPGGGASPSNIRPSAFLYASWIRRCVEDLNQLEEALRKDPGLGPVRNPNCASDLTNPAAAADLSSSQSADVKVVPSQEAEQVDVHTGSKWVVAWLTVGRYFSSDPSIVTEVRRRLEFRVRDHVGEPDAVVHWLDETRGESGSVNWLNAAPDGADVLTYVATAYCRCLFFEGSLPDPFDPGYRWTRAELAIQVFDVDPLGNEIVRLAVEKLSHEVRVSYRISNSDSVSRVRAMLADDVHPTILLLREAMTVGETRYEQINALV